MNVGSHIVIIASDSVDVVEATLVSLVEPVRWFAEKRIV